MFRLAAAGDDHSNCLPVGYGNQRKLYESLPALFGFNHDTGQMRHLRENRTADLCQIFERPVAPGKDRTYGFFRIFIE